MFRFTTITLTGAALLGLSYVFAGPFPGLALFYITLFSFFMDRFVAMAAPSAPEGAEFPAGHGLSTLLGLLHFPLFFGAVYTLAQDNLSSANKIALFIAVSLYLGQVSNSNAHELIHRSSRWVRRLGAAVYSSILFGHHTSGHLLVHHVKAATYTDPNSARMGETFYHFFFRAWGGSFAQGLAAENRRKRPLIRHPYTWYILGALVSMGLALALAGWAGLAWMLGISLYSTIQLMLSDYILHYGLQRKTLDTGRLEPVGDRHSWNAPFWFSSAMMMNSTRHSDHHANPQRPYPQLRLDTQNMPQLPYCIPVMAMLAFVPKLWRRVMDRRARVWAS
jgi:alkane 1-monooxygenase